MALVNNTMIIRRQLISRLAQLIRQKDLANKIDRLPIEMAPRNMEAQRRCCIFKERAIARYKSFPLLGFVPNDEDDELITLSQLVEQACQREAPSEKILTVVDEACSNCVKVNYVVTNLCKGCVASPCYMNCPKGAIHFTKNGQAEIDHEKCVNCGICKNACPYHSIVYVPVPCEESCPVGAISKDENGNERIDDEKCIYCGKCVNACPFGSIFEMSHIIDIFRSMERGEKVIALPAPSIMGQYREPMGKIVTALKNLGFHDVVEVAEGATVTTRNESVELQEKLNEGQLFMTTSCCPSYVQAVEKHMPGVKPFVSHTKSPMYYAAEIAREKYPDAKLVFIGPCIAKRKEAQMDPNIDYIMTYEEVDAFFDGFDIRVSEQEVTPLARIEMESRNYGQSGGVAAAVLAQDLKVDVNEMKINGINKKSMALLKTFAKGRATANFIEVMACEGGCVGGPSANVDVVKGRKQLDASLKQCYSE